MAAKSDEEEVWRREARKDWLSPLSWFGVAAVLCHVLTLCRNKA